MSSPRPGRRIGVFGGTFDPPHVGHLLAATDASEQLSLDQLLWIPVGTQPLKGPGTAAPAADRLRMVELTVADHDVFTVDATEINREGLSFTVDTLAGLRQQLPTAELFLLAGEDSWRTFGKWREPARIRELARVAVLVRGGRSEGSGRGRSSGGEDAPIELFTRRVDVSATEIRERVRTGLSIRGFVADPVARYIDERKLYR